MGQRTMNFIGTSRERLQAALALPRIVVMAAWPRTDVDEIFGELRKLVPGAAVIANPREFFARDDRTLPGGDPVIFGSGDTRPAIRELATASRRGVVLVTLPDLLEVLDLVREEEAAGTPFDAFGGIVSVVRTESGVRVDALAFDAGVLAKVKAGASAPLILEDARGEGEL